MFEPISSRADRVSVTETVYFGLITGRIKQITIKIAICSFPAPDIQHYKKCLYKVLRLTH